MSSPMDLDTAGATETAQAVARGDVSAIEACEAAIARIEERDGKINAIVVRDFERAREAARELDRNRVANDTRPLLGVPMTVKESHNVAGLPSSWGFPEFTGPVDADSVVVSRLKAAGAVILGKTNVSVALADWQSVNPVYGRTCNPFDPGRVPGGSSGGAAAALAAGMVPLEFGSDIGGSIRIPAHFCGVFGHKPTYGVIPSRGQAFPGTNGVEIPLAVVGPMARSARDLSLALEVTAGPEEGSGYRLDLPPMRRKRLGEFRVLVLADHPACETDVSVSGPVRELAAALSERGVDVRLEAVGLPDLRGAHDRYMKMLNTIMSRGVPGTETISAHVWMDLLDHQMRLARQWRSLFQDIDVVLAPPFGTPAFPHDDEPDWRKRTLPVNGLETPFGRQLAWPGLATFPGLPATAVPIATTDSGLPTGVQIVGDRYADRTTIGFAQFLEQAGLTLNVSADRATCP